MSLYDEVPKCRRCIRRLPFYVSVNPACYVIVLLRLIIVILCYLLLYFKEIQTLKNYIIKWHLTKGADFFFSGRILRPVWPGYLERVGKQVTLV
jgi:hypothetical protein